ncbi:hypothetical protein Ssi03_21740 [Sphaerisporangium siamense]|uniref:Uncharacterized protein n=1 Tax=Sphaerisporangium siamense TaxID=795645 RepID=A0A7W7D7Y4_9ACTN|nr:hypothetical protein [Sphaerisporangium siamense]MBB4701907.1 hypothetical protein [Sphaerisporangium siamense]GII84184.1 hypothetical protein Ssi03_21740 [Sphaerisporangium siamense]
MAARYYTASKVRDKGRERYSVIFRHPIRLDPATGKPGRRVRRGLGTSDEAEAEELVTQLNMLLSDESYWSATARTNAEGRFDGRVVSAFFDGMTPAREKDSARLREKLLPLPSADDGYRRVLLLGTTGAGKTTVVRQFLGTDPESDRFPSTSTAKTTVADMEIVMGPGPFRAVVTFFPRDEIVDHLADCASKAALAALDGAGDGEIRRLLLDHENQRFRFSYVLGRRGHRPVALAVSSSSGDDFDEFDDEEPDEGAAQDFSAQPAGLVGIDLDATMALVDEAVVTLRDLVKEHEDYARTILDTNDREDERVVRELLDEELDKILRGDERFNAIVDFFLEEIEKRFYALPIGTIKRDQQAWPLTWTWETDERAEFLRGVNRFTSNYAPLFGHLLTPLVDGIRVAGPFAPLWLEGEVPRLVLIDGEGLGHTPKSAAAISTPVAKAIDEADAVLLVDNAAMPVQAAPASAVRSILTSGNADKLLFCFTHFDEVKGDNLRGLKDRRNHVLASVENLLSNFRIEFGVRSELMLRRRLDVAVFLADIDKPLDPDTQSGRLSISQFKKLLSGIEATTERPELGPARPVYDKANLVLAVAAAATSFHRRWNAVLGIQRQADVAKEHWTRIKALNRRFAEDTSDQYDSLRPASDLREFLKDEIYKTLQRPVEWTGDSPADDEALTVVINELSQAIARRLSAAIRDRLSVRPVREWQHAYYLSGSGSTFVRARHISNAIFARNVPIPGVTPSPDHNDFLHAVIAVVNDAAEEVGVELR